MSPTRREFVRTSAAAAAGPSLPNVSPFSIGRGAPTAEFERTWASLSRFRTPDWFRDAEFGMWAHGGPQCQPERGYWYARQTGG